MLAAMLLAIPLVIQAQELSKKQERQLQKQLKKEQQAEEAAQMAELVAFMVERKQFVLEANQLRDRRGVTINVSSMINFIACDSTTGVIQVGSQYYVGMNGVGGITVEGSPDNYKYNFREKNNSYQISYTLRTSLGTYDVSLYASANGRAEATVTSNWPGRITYVGHLALPSVSRVYKGVSY